MADHRKATEYKSECVKQAKEVLRSLKWEPSMIDASKEYRTRDGREVRIYATDGGGVCPVHGAIRITRSCWAPEHWDKRGIAREGSEEVDLIEVRPRIKQTMWLNIGKGGTAEGYNSKYWAVKCRAMDCIACIPVEVEFEQGEGLESVDCECCKGTGLEETVLHPDGEECHECGGVGRIL